MATQMQTFLSPLQLPLVLDVDLADVLYSLITPQPSHELVNFVKCPSGYFLTIQHIICS